MDWSHIFQNLLSVIYDLLYFGVIIGTIIVIILDNRNPVKTIAWVLILLLFPYLGLAFYFFFGRSTRHERIISKKRYNRLMKRPMEEFLTQESFHLPADQFKVAQLFKNTNQALPFEGNDVEIFTDGYHMLQALIRELSKAKQHIHLQYYIFEDDAVGRLIKDLLIQKAHEGVKVRVIYDDVGCWNVPTHFFEEMQGEGIEIQSFLKVRYPIFTSKVNYRNHRKITIIDGICGFIGGMNIAVRYLRGVKWGKWRDTHICIHGKAVYGLQTSFLLDWYFTDQTLITSSDLFPNMESVGSSLIQIVTSEPTAPWKEIMQGLCLSIASAKKYFYIQTPYFLPTESIMQALQIAALAGVDIRIMIPEKTDSLFTQLGSYSYLEESLQAGINIYFYQPGFLHSKLMVSDDTFSTIGSTNMDFRSFEHNFEINAFMYDKPTAIRMKSIFLNDQHDCRQIFLKNWKKRPKRQKIEESLVHVFSPLL